MCPHGQVTSALAPTLTTPRVYLSVVAVGCHGLPAHCRLAAELRSLASCLEAWVCFCTASIPGRVGLRLLRGHICTTGLEEDDLALLFARIDLLQKAEDISEATGLDVKAAIAKAESEQAQGTAS